MPTLGDFEDTPSTHDNPEGPYGPPGEPGYMLWGPSPEDEKLIHEKSGTPGLIHETPPEPSPISPKEVADRLDFLARAKELNHAIENVSDQLPYPGPHRWTVVCVECSCFYSTHDPYSGPYWYEQANTSWAKKKFGIKFDKKVWENLSCDYMLPQTTTEGSKSVEAEADSEPVPAKSLGKAAGFASFYGSPGGAYATNYSYNSYNSYNSTVSGNTIIVDSLGYSSDQNQNTWSGKPKKTQPKPQKKPQQKKYDNSKYKDKTGSVFNHKTNKVVKAK